MTLISRDIRPRTSNKLIYPYNDIPYKKLVGTIDAYDNRCVEIIVKLGHKNSGTYGRIAISKDIIILSIVMWRFCYSPKKFRLIKIAKKINANEVTNHKLKVTRTHVMDQSHVKFVP
jgi:hypothetical protein